MKRGFLHLSGALVEHFREGIAPFRLCYINGPNGKSNIFFIVNLPKPS